jgi:3-keto steroid reductase
VRSGSQAAVSLFTKFWALSGVGFGICQRLLLQLSYASPPDCSLDGGKSPSPPIESLTLVLACRNASRATAAKKKLLAFVDSCVEDRERTENQRDFAKNFRLSLKIECIQCDLSLLESVFAFCDEVKER